jgi:hypothetical protein
MAKLIFKNRFLVVTLLCLVFALSYRNAFARDWRESSQRRHEVVMRGHERYPYRDGRFYRPSWFGFEFVFGTPHVGGIVKVLPSGHRTIVVAGARYYNYNSVYYRDCPTGYVVVPQPVVIAQPEPLYGQTIIINVPNSNGSYTQVTLVRRDNGYIGPQGEFYPGNPTVEQLKVLYGK